MYKLALMGGTLDPIHYGHLVAAEGARSEFKLDKVIFVPSGNPPHKVEVSVTDAEHRFEMTQLAIATNPNFEISRLEVDRQGLSYAVDTVREFSRVYGPKAEIYFITGADAILEILTWKKVEELMSSCYFIAATRPGYVLDELKEKLESKEDFLNRIFVLEVPALAISSTDIRNRVAMGKSIKYLVPETVEQYILENKLYFPKYK